MQATVNEDVTYQYCGKPNKKTASILQAIGGAFSNHPK